MKCRICGLELSDRVCRIHETTCTKKPVEPVKSDMTKAEVIQALTDKNIKFNPRDKKEVLEAILNFEDKIVSPDEVE